MLQGVCELILFTLTLALYLTKDDMQNTVQQELQEFTVSLKNADAFYGSAI